MACSRPRPHGTARRGVAAIELALVLPLLALLLVFGADFARAYYYFIIVDGCASNGAIYGSQNATNAADTAGINTAALTNASNVSPQPTVASSTSTDASGNLYVTVTVTYVFSTITSYPGVTTPLTITQTVKMRVVPTSPSYG